MKYPGFIGPSYVSQTYMADMERLINRYPEQNESPTAPSQWALPKCPGFASIVSVSESPLRGMFYQSGRTFFAAGAQLYELNTNDTTTALGSISVDAHPVIFMTNGDAGSQLGLTSGDQFYSLNLTTSAFTTVLTSGATMCGFLDGYGYILDAATSTLKITGFEDFSTIQAGNVLQRNTGSDPWKALYIVNRLAYLLGEHTSDVGQDTGASPFPLTLIPEAFMQQGIAATFSGARLNNSLLWLSQNEQGRGQFVSATGYTPGRVSTHAVEASIQSYDTITDAVAFSYQEAGHTFYIVTFPDAERTWAFDDATKLFHERLYWNTTTGSWLGYRPMFFASQANRNIVGDRLTGAIYRMGLDLYTDVDGAYIRCVRQTPRLAFGQRRFVTHSVQLVCDVGIGAVSGQGSNPQMILQSSKDGGKTFGNERWATMGALGKYNTRVRWTMLGQARNRVDRFIDTDPVASRLVDCEIDVSVGAS